MKFKRVPVEWTDEIAEAMAEAYRDNSDKESVKNWLHLRPMYEAALSAAPTPPEVEPEDRLVGCHDGCGTRLAQEVPLRKQPKVTITTTTPPSPKASWDADGNPLNLDAAARDLIRYIDAIMATEGSWDSLSNFHNNLRKFLPEGK